MTPSFGTPRPDARARNAAYAVIHDADGKVAFVRGRRGLFLPGGGARTGESPEQTVAREVEEETGRAARGLRPVGEAIQHFVAGETPYRMHAVFFLAELGDGNEEEGEHELIWMPPATARGELFHECHGWAIERALRRRPRPGGDHRGSTVS